ncbi:hypothetical protein G3I77_12765 [Streptomyces sp. D2-8]|uniref:hypothetical protein n=1 Tax=Streptomyces sp. D2-8 TaxID=2707767 RepID=UPI0020C09B33|nr:hypothetical protein [Streptomyces sp. D2-8]MCK8433874.1 hypothetical protein [Streptomyces sp. D2-8]
MTDEQFYEIADAEIEKYLTLLEKVPDDVLAQGGDATLAWLDENSGRRVQAMGLITCTGLILAAVGGALIPASKVVKVAKIVKKYGVKRVINAIKGVRKGKGNTLSRDLKDIALIFLGVDQIKEACT